MFVTKEPDAQWEKALTRLLRDIQRFRPVALRGTFRRAAGKRERSMKTIERKAKDALSTAVQSGRITEEEYCAIYEWANELEALAVEANKQTEGLIGMVLMLQKRPTTALFGMKNPYANFGKGG